MSLQKVAIIGTGITALSIGYHLPLTYPSVEITYFDKGLKAGGRVATKRTRKDSSLVYDHGASFFTGENLQKGNFLTYLNSIKAISSIPLTFVKPKNLTEKQSLKFFEKKVFIGEEGADSIPLKILNQIKCVSATYFQHRVNEIVQSKQHKLSLKFEPNQKTKSYQGKQFGQFDKVFCCIPHPQAKALKQNLVPLELLNKVQVKYHATWVAMISVEKGEIFQRYQNSDVIDFSDCQNSPIQFAVKQNAKFKCSQKQVLDNWALYFSDRWTTKYLNSTKQQIENIFCDEILKLYSQNAAKIKNVVIHRWLYSRPERNDLVKALVSEDNSLVFAGDWLGGLSNISQCWQLGLRVVKDINEQKEQDNGEISSKL